MLTARPMATSASWSLARVVSRFQINAKGTQKLTVRSIEINAAATVSALVHSGRFDLTSTYFFVAGIGGVNPEVATICSVTFARYAIQVALQYEFDARVRS